MASLLALSRAASEESKRLDNRKQWAHAGTLTCGILTLFLSAPIAYVLGLAALLLEVTAWAFRLRSRSVNSLAEEGRRMAIVVDSLGDVARRIDLTDLQGTLSEGFESVAHKWDEENYFASTKQVGLARFHDNLQEVVFWSKHLYARAARRSFLLAAAVVVVIIALLLVLLPFSPASSSLNIARVLVLVVLFFIATDAFGQALAWRDASDKLRELDQRLENETDNVDGYLTVFGDYAACTAATPPIPTSIYNKHKKRLDQLWKQRVG